MIKKKDILAVALSAADARAAWLAGTPITVVSLDARRNGAWAYACLRAAPDAEVRLPGRRPRWTPLAGYSTPALHRARIARVGAAVLNGKAGHKPHRLAFLAEANCHCGDPLHSPESILAGVGPVCSGRAAEREAKAKAKREAGLARMAALLPAPAGWDVADTSTPGGVRCPGTCSLDTVCPDCG